MKTARAREKCSTCPVPVVVVIDEFVRSLEQRNYSPKSIDTYRRALLDLGAFLGRCGVVQVTDVTADALLDYRLSLVERGFKPSSIAVYARAVRGLFGLLEDRRAIFINPAVDFTVRQPPRRIRSVPSEAEIRAMLETPGTTTACGLRDRAILETAYGTGARRAELASLTVSSVDLDGRTIRFVGKGRKERVVPLTKSASQWIGRYLEEARPTFPGEDSEALWLGKCGPLSVAGMTFTFTSHSASAGITPPLHPHAVRRACATHMLRNGASPVEIQQLLGHADLKHLSQYLAVSITELRNMHRRSKLGR